MSVVNNALATLSEVILGKESQLKLAVCCMLSEGHLLIEDLPGMGKTTLSNALAKVFGLEYSRIQFTSDLLPADILGVSVFERMPEAASDSAGQSTDSSSDRRTETSGFRFHQGPIFAQVVLADEVNRATAKSQSALLEAMEERQVTVEGNTRPLPEPFFVIATQNPTTQAGTFPLPESQLDRFLMRISLGYPDQRAERELLEGTSRRAMVDALDSVVQPEALAELQQRVLDVRASAVVLDYIQRILAFSRREDVFRCGISPRGGLALLKAAKAWAVMEERDFLIPEDVQAVMAAVIDHRVQPGAASKVMDNVAALA